MLDENNEEVCEQGQHYDETVKCKSCVNMSTPKCPFEWMVNPDFEEGFY